MTPTLDLPSNAAFLAAYAGDWNDDKNARRFALIDRELNGTLSEDELNELDELQMEFRRFRRRIAPLPIGEMRALLNELERKAARNQS